MRNVYLNGAPRELLGNCRERLYLILRFDLAVQNIVALRPRVLLSGFMSESTTGHQFNKIGQIADAPTVAPFDGGKQFRLIFCWQSCT